MKDGRYPAECTALLFVDPYNDFLSEKVSTTPPYRPEAMLTVIGVSCIRLWVTPVSGRGR